MKDNRQFYLKKWLDLIQEKEDGTQAIYNAMDEYSKEMCIEFKKFWDNYNPSEGKFPNDEELYIHFINLNKFRNLNINN